MSKMKKEMKNRRVENKKFSKMLAIGIISALALFSIFIALSYAQSQQELQDELNNLTSYLSDNGYSWLVGYNINMKNGGLI